MSFWNSRTQMEHAKTRPIKIEERKANGHDEKDEELDEYEELEKLKLETQKQLNEIKSLHARIVEYEKEIKHYKEINDKNTLFMQQIILELINKPAPKSLAQSYLENKSSSIAGPKGKLP